MADNKTNENDSKNNTNEGVDDSEEENEILEESPCGRWHKRKEQVEQRDIPGIDATYLAMDTEEGVEVVWNEVRFSERKYFRAREETISEVFDRLIQLEHPNIVKLHKYWVHKDIEKPRVVFITEYMSSGSLKQFLRKTKKNLIRMALNAWKRWCTQTLSALCYLHSSQPSIVHGNLNCDTIFISYNGLIKIGAVAPDAIHKHVKTVRGDSKANLHYLAPEIGCISDTDGTLSPAVDIYSFGMCALEMAALEISPNGETSHINDDVINSTIESLDNPLQKDFITRCLSKDPKDRPSARELLFHPIIFEVPSLKLFAAHVIVNTSSYQPEQLTEEVIYQVLCLQNNSDRVLAEIRHNDESRSNVEVKQSDKPKVEFEKFFEEVRNGSFPLTAIVTTIRPPLISRQRTISPEVSGESTKQLNSPDNPYDEETRRLISVSSTLEPSDANASDKRLVISLHIIFDDKINRKLSTRLELLELIPSSLAQELVFYGFVNKDDQNIISDLLTEMSELFISSGNTSVSCQKSQQIATQQTSQQTTQTTVEPLVLPIVQPIIQPIVQPTIQPTVQPIVQTLIQPTIQPTVPSIGQPIVQPTVPSIVQSTIQPILQPTVQSIGQPIIQSTIQPIVQPTVPSIGQFTVQPILQPTVPSVVEPTAQSVVQPTFRPIVQSTVQCVQPTVPPIVRPSVQQSTQTTIQSSVQPTVQPSNQPIIQTSVRPTVQQTIQPLVQPIVHPLVQPTVPSISQPMVTSIGTPQPTLQPTVQPIVRPTVQPMVTSIGSPQPTLQPIVQPIVRPTVQPMVTSIGQPTNTSIGQPTVPLIVQPTVQSITHPTVPSIVQPTAQPILQPTVPLIVKPTVTSIGQPTAQPIVQSMIRPTIQPMVRQTVQPIVRPTVPLTVRPTVQQTTQTTVQPTVQPIIEPTLQPAVQQITQPLVQPTNQTTTQISTQLKSGSTQQTTQTSKLL